jgi:hypothetical protein
MLKFDTYFKFYYFLHKIYDQRINEIITILGEISVNILQECFKCYLCIDQFMILSLQIYLLLNISNAYISSKHISCCLTISWATFYKGMIQ